MMEFLLIIGLIILIIWAFSTNLLLGVLILIGVGVYYYFKRYASLCYLKIVQSFFIFLLNIL